MKRPQFSLRLMLLVVALSAALFAWRRAVENKNRAVREGQINELQAELDGLERSRQSWLDQFPPAAFNIDKSLYTRSLDSEIAQTRKRLDHLKP